jgi:psiF repeat
MRIVTLVCASALALFVSGAAVVYEAAAQNATAGSMGGVGPSPATEAKPGSDPLPAPERDPAARSARSIECAQKADAQGLEGKPRKHFLHECRSGV